MIVGAVLSDFSAAFDIIDHSQLMEKLVLLLYTPFTPPATVDDQIHNFLADLFTNLTLLPDNFTVFTF
jgi:hypothetical protein